MTCKHTRSAVTNSGSPETRFGSSSRSDVIMMRRRKCLDCGERFTTYEITREQYDNALPPHLAVEMASHSLLKRFSDFLKTIVEE